MESNPDWVPSLHLGHTEVKATTAERFAGRIKKQRATRGENSAPAASQDATGQKADMNETGDKLITPPTRVGSRHFNPEDLRELASERGRWLLKRGAPDKVWINVSMEHDYASVATGPAAVDLFLEENQSLQEEIRQLRQQVGSITLRQRFGIHRFAASDKDIRFFTRFASYDLLIYFWALIEPSLPSMVTVRQAQRGHLSDSNATSTTHSLQPIDELFLFLNYLALGSKQQDLADRYNLHQSTVSWIITSWGNFLYSLLGSVNIWIPEEQIRRSLPADFKDYPDTTVILDCTELRCQCPSSCVLQSQVCSSYESHCTLKGLIGIAPHGAVTFISGLFAGSISDKQITRESGILSLLTPGMAVMVDRSFLIDDIVPCKVYRPAFLSGRPQMSAADVGETQAVARLRVHVERLIRRVKEHKFFDSEIPLCLYGSVSQLYTVACLLTNCENGPLVKV